LLSGGESSEKVYGYLDDFVKTNIWEKWDDTTREFMLRTSALRELTPALCEALTAVTNSDKFLISLVKKGVFISKLHNGAYRYHHLFQQFLQQMTLKRGDDFMNSLLEIEGDWYLSQADFYSSIDCFILSKNHEGIAKCFDLLADSGSNSFSLGSLLPLISNPEFEIAAKKYPRMLFLLTLGAFAEGRANDMLNFMDEYYARQPEILANNPSSAYKSLFLCIYDFRVSPSQMMDKIGSLSTASENLSIAQWSVSMHMPLLHRGLKDYSEFATGDINENCHLMQSKVGWLLGKESAMLHQTLAAELFYEQGYLDKAHKHAINAMAELKSHFLAESNFCAMAICVYVLDAIGEMKESVGIIKAISQMIEDTKSYHLCHNFNAFTARREIALGNVKAAEKWLKVQKIGEQTLYGIYADVTTCRAYIATGKYDLAIILLGEILKIATDFNRPLDILEVQILLAIAYSKKKRGFQKNALKCLEVAVITAYPYNYVQMFVNDGTELASMFYKLQKRVEQYDDKDKKHINFIKMLYMKTRACLNSELSNDFKIKSVKFTNKQKEVMGLLAQGKRYSDIADAMGIKRASVCAHLQLIYNKLGVATATDAVVKINALDLID